ncbi:uncharacterized protein LOC114358446 [Ostrinia furnacalis]|uniref:uncharacterized protein LOC114358446 n=1 Tax=Ostrinia furnacalis TaxID=93504 RepID=UPI001039C565|nr:uncharacterized protein LOC114358446 [Ostrinia furnacalis]
MDAMDVMSSDEEVEDINSNKENVDDVSNNVVTQTENSVTGDSVNSPVNSVSSRQSTNNNVHEEMQVKLQIGNKSNPKIASEVGIHKTTSMFNRGDGAPVQNVPAADTAPSTSKVVVRRRVRAARVQDILRPILPRKSKDRAKLMIRTLARGIIIPRGVVFQRRVIRRRRAPRPIIIPKPEVKRIRFGRKKVMGKKSLFTVWRRSRRARSSDSRMSEYCSCGHCDCNQSYY